MTNNGMNVSEHLYRGLYPGLQLTFVAPCGKNTPYRGLQLGLFFVAGYKIRGEFLHFQPHGLGLDLWCLIFLRESPRFFQ